MLMNGYVLLSSREESILGEVTAWLASEVLWHEVPEDPLDSIVEWQQQPKVAGMEHPSDAQYRFGPWHETAAGIGTAPD
jgi:hypothetical protein